MDLKAIFKSASRNKIGYSIIVVQIAVTLAVLANCADMVGSRFSNILVSSGVAEKELVYATVGVQDGPNANSLSKDALVRIKAIPGVLSATLTNQLPLSSTGIFSDLKLNQTQQAPSANAAEYFGGNLVKVLGLTLVDGHFFGNESYVNYNDLINRSDINLSNAIITKSLADKMFPGKRAVGETFFQGRSKVRVIGVVSALLQPEFSPDWPNLSVIYPVIMNGANNNYFLVRCSTDDRDAVIKKMVNTLQVVYGGAPMLARGTWESLRVKYYSKDKSFILSLSLLSLLLIVIMGLGIGGLLSYWVTQRTKEIGVRRALGATRGNIAIYFLGEGLWLCMIGVIVGSAFAYMMRYIEMTRFPLHHLHVEYILGGSLVLCLVTLMATMAPSLRASFIHPSSAVKSL